METKNTTATRKAGTASATAKKATPAKKNGQTQSAGTPTTRKAGTGKAKVDPYIDKQGQQIGVGGTAEVPIEMMVMPEKGYSQRAMAPEKFPFSKLEPARKVAGEIVGPSFFIPHYELPDRLIATARKRHKAFKFWSRKDTAKIDGKAGMVAGKRVWRAPVEKKAAAAK